MALPNTLQVARQLMRAVLGGQRTGSFKQMDGFNDKLHVIASLPTAYHLFVEAFCSLDVVLYTSIPNALNISSAEA